MAADEATDQNLVPLERRFGTPAPAMLATVFPSISKMLEALCLSSAAAKRRPELPKAFAFEACEPKQPSQPLKANYADLSEADFVQRGAGKSRPGKAWMPDALPEVEDLSWTSADEEERMQDASAHAPATASTQWACPRCTLPTPRCCRLARCASMPTPSSVAPRVPQSCALVRAPFHLLLPEAMR
mmetsp:Transcript_10550/g.37037  ORF Transcript_10550/g.37037 Transcript_10550/m.37037 type:complete len:186 (-) Transcript_10550:626-1183(-)